MLYGFSSINSLDSKTKTGFPCERSRIFFHPFTLKLILDFVRVLYFHWVLVFGKKTSSSSLLVSVFDQCHSNYESTCLCFFLEELTRAICVVHMGSLKNFFSFMCEEFRFLKKLGVYIP